MIRAADKADETVAGASLIPDGDGSIDVSGVAQELEVEASSIALSDSDIEGELHAVGLSDADAIKIAARSVDEAFSSVADDYREVTNLEYRLEAAKSAMGLEGPSKSMRAILPIMSLGLLGLLVLAGIGLVGLLVTALKGNPHWIMRWFTFTRALVAVGAECGLMVLYSYLSTRHEKRLATSKPAQTVNSLESQLNAKRENIVTALVQEWIRPSLRSAVNDARAPSWSIALTLNSGDGLFQPPSPQTEIITEARDAIEGRLTLWNGGSIGVAGPRGIGKSTLIETICRVNDTKSGKRLGIPVSAPVQYDSRDFILHLFAMVCEKVLGAYELPAPSIGVLLSQPVVARKGNRKGVVQTLNRIYADPFRRIFLGRPAAVADYGPTGVGSTASELLQEIRYQQTFTAGWSGSLSLPIGVQVDRGQSYARASKSLPEVVDKFRAFLEQLGAGHQVVIGIDEVDKIATEQDAQRFLDDIKGIFAARNCFFIVSVSEDALSAFERRGLPLRDAVDSALDDVIAMNYLDWGASRELIRRRVVGLPEPFNALCHVLGGGLPRDILRVGRSLAEAHATMPPTTLSGVTESLISGEHARKRSAAQIAIRASVDGKVAISREVLATVSEEIRVQEVAIARDILTEAPGYVLETAVGIITLEFLAYAYFLATVREFFEDAKATNELRASTETRAGPKSIEYLVQARQTFSLDLLDAWELISKFRNAWNLIAVPFPKVTAGPTRSSNESGA